MVVRVDVADVRSKPESPSQKYEFDPLQETQVLKGEPVLVLEEKGKWARIECPEQMEYTHNNRWEGYPGWILKKALTADLSAHHHLKTLPISQPDLRTKIVSYAMQHLGSPYLWGGRSLHNPKETKMKTGVDCSGLVNWSFRQIGWFVPRDAHEQYMKSRPVNPASLQPADLIFLAEKDKPQKIVHVAFYAGNEELVEAPQSGETVRKMSFLKRFGKNRSDLKSGDAVGDRIIYFGTLIPDEEKESDFREMNGGKVE